MAPRVLDRLTRLMRPREYVRYRGLRLPPKELRLCGQAFMDDAHFVETALREADRLIQTLGVSWESAVLDIGCGSGRVPIGLVARLGRLTHYDGIDVSRRHIEWCTKHIEGRHEGLHFVHLEMENARYHPEGAALHEAGRLPFGDGRYDVIYLYSVFSHLTSEHVQFYIREFARLLKPTGTVFLTAFLEEDVPACSINPSDYRRPWRGALHCVRYEKRHFEEMLSKHGLRIDSFDYETETDGQSAVYIGRVS